MRARCWSWRGWGECYGAGIPPTFETSRNDLGRIAVATERHEARCGGSGDVRLQLFGIGQPIPVLTQSRCVVSQAGKRFRVRTRPQHFALCGVVDLALYELFDQHRNLAVPSRCLQRAQFEPQRSGVQPRFLAKLRKTHQGVARTPSFQRRLGFEHQPRDGETRQLRFRTCERRIDGVEVARLERRASRDERSDRR